MHVVVIGLRLPVFNKETTYLLTYFSNLILLVGSFDL